MLESDIDLEPYWLWHISLVPPACLLMPKAKHIFRMLWGEHGCNCEQLDKNKPNSLGCSRVHWAALVGTPIPRSVSVFASEFSLHFSIWPYPLWLASEHFSQALWDLIQHFLGFIFLPFSTTSPQCTWICLYLPCKCSSLSYLEESSLLQCKVLCHMSLTYPPCFAEYNQNMWHRSCSKRGHLRILVFSKPFSL